LPHWRATAGKDWPSFRCGQRWGRQLPSVLSALGPVVARPNSASRVRSASWCT